MAVLVDTGALYALADADDAWHERAVEWLDGERDVLAVPVTVLPDVCYLLSRRLGQGHERQFVESIGRGEIAVEPIVRADLARAAILPTYPAIGFVGASVVALAERLGITRLATTDRRHFGRCGRSTHPGWTSCPDGARLACQRGAVVHFGVAVHDASGNNSVVECDLAKVEVAGSNPVSRSNFRATSRRTLPAEAAQPRRRAALPSASPRPQPSGAVAKW